MCFYYSVPQRFILAGGDSMTRDISKDRFEEIVAKEHLTLPSFAEGLNSLMSTGQSMG